MKDMIDGTKLVIYIDGKAVGIAEVATLTIPEYDGPILAPAVSNFTIELIARWPGSTHKQMLEMEWVRSKKMPRKIKKQYRKKLQIAYAAEVHRDKVMEFLDTLGN